METEELKGRLEAVCQRAIAGGGKIETLERLSGGANMESWRFGFGGALFVLRRLPDGLGKTGDAASSEALSLEDQARLLEIAAAHGVKAPAVRARLRPEDGLGDGFVMACMPGEALPQKILGKPEYAAALSGLTREWAEQLRAIHAIPVGALPAGLSARTPKAMLDALEERYATLGGDSPVYALAFGWLRHNLPEPVTPALCHGDFRMGNLLITPDGLSAVLDWELAHLGDPAEDLAYGCMPSWRFGHYDKPLGGFGSIEGLLDAYEAAGGERISDERFRFWLVYATLWWGICCLTMAAIWRSGEDRSLERVVIGRRFSEVEIDLMLLLDDAAPQALAPAAGSGEQPDAGKPGADEVIRALAEWVEQRVLPQAQGHARFEARVALNALGMAERDAKRGAATAQEAEQRLRALGIDAATLHERLLRDGESALDPAIRDHLRRLALDQCGIDQPKYAGLAAARARWTA